VLAPIVSEFLCCIAWAGRLALTSAVILRQSSTLNEASRSSAFIVPPYTPNLRWNQRRRSFAIFCAGLIPPKEESSPSRAHYPSIRLIKQSSQGCSICKILLADWSLENIQRRLPDMDKETYESIVPKVKLKEFQRVRSALSWTI
jgi:hypothetical protein